MTRISRRQFPSLEPQNTDGFAVFSQDFYDGNPKCQKMTEVNYNWEFKRQVRVTKGHYISMGVK